MTSINKIEAVVTTMKDGFPRAEKRMLTPEEFSRMPNALLAEMATPDSLGNMARTVVINYQTKGGLTYVNDEIKYLKIK